MAKSAQGRGGNRAPNRGTGTGEQDDRLADFDERLERARGRPGDAPEAQARGSAMGAAFRISSELVVGLFVGGFIGWQLDAWLDTSPVFLLLFFVLGAAAGIWNVIRTALMMQSDTPDMQDVTKKPERGPDGK
ncbi:MAG TPA: AtpZ/AtpI family protein [Rhizobiales bacterium]|nr:ATP synthase protein I [bacterium BMS3Bbin10]HDO52249.1 AtpZ/AtpI family protein [Hyphomicrobiales bacterium]